MKYNLTKINFDIFFKFMLLIFIAYFLYLLTLIAIQLKNNAEIGRYQFNQDTYYLIDTKTKKKKKVKNIR